MTVKDIHSVLLRMPINLYAQIKALAAQHRRSVQQEVLWAIEQHIQKCEKPDAYL